MIARWLKPVALASVLAAPMAHAADVHEFVPAGTVFYNGMTEALPKTRLADAYPPSWQDLTSPTLDDDPAKLADEGGPAAGMLVALLQDYYASWAEDDHPLTRFGIAQEGEYAVYTVGALPVVRASIDDPSALQDRLAHAEQAAGIKPTQRKIHGTAVRRYGFSLSESGQDLNLIAAIHDGQAVLTLTGSAIPEDAVATALGADRPDSSLAESGRPGKLSKRHDLIDGSVAYLDHEAIVAGITDPEANRFGAMIRPLMETWYGAEQPVPFDKLRQQACHQEASEMATSWPYSVSGFSDIAPKAQQVAISNLVRVANDDVSGQLSRLRGHIPKAVDQRAILELGVGLHIQELVPALRQLAEDFKQDERQCQAMRSAQKAVHSQSIGQLSIIAQTLGDTRGISASLLALDQANEATEGEAQGSGAASPRAVLEVANAKPAALWRFTKSALGLSNDVADPEPGGEPVAIPGVGGLGLDWQVALRNNALIMLLGDTPLPKAAGEEGLEANGVLRVREDIGALAEADEAYSQSLGQGVPGLPSIAAPASVEAVNAYLDMGLDFTDDGIGLDMVISPAN